MKTEQTERSNVDTSCLLMSTLLRTHDKTLFNPCNRLQVNEIVAEIPILQMQLPEEKDPACNCGRYSENFTSQQSAIMASLALIGGFDQRPRLGAVLADGGVVKKIDKKGKLVVQLNEHRETRKVSIMSFFPNHCIPRLDPDIQFQVLKLVKICHLNPETFCLCCDQYSTVHFGILTRASTPLTTKPGTFSFKLFFVILLLSFCSELQIFPNSLIRCVHVREFVIYRSLKLSWRVPTPWSVNLFPSSLRRLHVTKMPSASQRPSSVS